MTDTLLRHWVMLRRIPRHPRKVTVRELLDYLRDQGYTTTERTIQRDLNRLSGQIFGLMQDDRSRPHGWCWGRDAVQMDIPGMEPQTALAFKLAEHFSGRLMAPSTRSSLEPYFRQAEQVLAETPSPVSAWPEKIQSTTRGQSLIPPAVDAGILHVVYDGLFNDRQFRARYQRRYDGEVRDYVISPLGIVFRDGVVYLVCQRNGQDEVVHLAMHRFLEAEGLDEPVHRPADFDLSDYVHRGGLNFKLSEEPLAITLRVTAETAVHLEETPLSEDQRMTAEVDARRQLTATVPDTAQLRWWLMGLGDQAEVIAPDALRDELIGRIRRALAQYQ
ncbi:WYL domain-containing protein [Spiribacter sp. 2438]|uniref:helix-turn-helix transcriptional regulator n=1 Tax=Spiribacter sp. 2438 TaxID=2666185 RepID=UPI0012B098C2|nr:WYL domain-containing protein [Spiribacter sp. 2438]QGM21755.1 WYL domain-containing protein [Spiribacter sp. 2438]